MSFTMVYSANGNHSKAWKWVEDEGKNLSRHQCYQRAGFVANMTTVGAVFLGLFSLLCIFILTACLRKLANTALGTGTTSPDTGSSSSSSSTQTPCSADTSSPSDQTSEAPIPDPPPPYVSESTSTTTDPASQERSYFDPSGNPKTKDARWRAEEFALSTLLLGLLTISLTTAGFVLQNLFYCPEIAASQDEVHFGKVVVWILFSCVVLFASSGLVAWLVKLLALWGPTTEVGRGKLFGYPIMLDGISLGLICIPAVLVTVVFVGVVELILLCQRICCPGASTDYVEVNVEDVEMGVEGMPSVDGQHASEEAAVK